MMDAPLRAFLADLFRTAVAAAHPASCLPPLLPPPPVGRLILLAAGKAAGSMAEVAGGFYLDRLKLDPERLCGIAVARHGYGRPLQIVTMIEAGHPVPDGAGLDAALRALEFADGATASDLVLVLMSGGASANWIAPVAGVTFADKQAVTSALLRSGATIGEINTVRKHLSRIKGGRLARYAYPATLVTIAISDVPGDDPSAIGSGPTVPDPTTLTQARAIVAKYRLDLPTSVTAALADANNESPKPGDPVFGGRQFEVAAAHAKLARELRAKSARAVILSGGELTVTIRGQGCGGPNQEYALALSIALAGMPAVAALAGDT